MTRLSVNINKIALLRNSRGAKLPDLLKAVDDIESYGAQGITVHPRPDERHIRANDVVALAGRVRTELNVEGFPDGRFMNLVMAARPRQVTLVPDVPGALTSTSGWETDKDLDFLKVIVAKLKSADVKVSIFLDAKPYLVESAYLTGADAIELYTEPFASAYARSEEEAMEALKPLQETGELALQTGLEVHAGHDLNLQNLKLLITHLPYLSEVSIGHALICDSLYLGLQNTVRMYLHQIHLGKQEALVAHR